MNKVFFERWTPRVLALLRVVTAYLFIQHGTAKFFGVPVSLGAVEPVSLMGLAGALELAGSLLLLPGLFVRPVAFILSGQMAVAYFMAHASQGAVLAPLVNDGESAVLFCFIFLFLSVAGGGAWSADALLKRRH